MKLSRGSLQLMALVISAGFFVQAADWNGASISVTYDYQGTPISSVGPFSVASPTVEVPEFPTLGGLSVNVEPLKIVISFFDNRSFLEGTFHGFIFGISGAPSLVGAVINGSQTDLSGMDNSRLTLSTSQLRIDFSGLGSSSANETVTVDLQFESVPEASAYAAGLAVLPALGLWWRRRSVQG